LASTSIGQEGLDFHLYCKKIFHWNLPSNPIDFEQREGRIHRYQGLVIRLNMASKYKDQIDYGNTLNNIGKKYLNMLKRKKLRLSFPVI
jgi:ERCC4-related helicase